MNLSKLTGNRVTATADSDSRSADRLRLAGCGVAPIILALTLGIASPAKADMTASGEPTFTVRDVELIARNESLRQALQTSPWAVYRALRIMEEPAPTTRDFRQPEGKEPFDSSRDPDLGQMQRVAPEAALDLFTLLKQASGSNQPR